MPRWPDPVREPRSRYRSGERDADARAEHTAQTTQWRRDVALAWWRGVESTLLAALAAGVPLPEACEAVQVTMVAAHGRRRWDPEWSERFDDALMAGRDESLDHGREWTYRHGKCRCPECRDAHNACRDEWSAARAVRRGRVNTPA